MAEHDTAVWKTMAGWIWSCRTCLAKGFTDSEADAKAARAAHDARPVPWWAVLLEARRG